MKNIEEKLIKILEKGGCTPKISGIAKKTKEPSTTIHYNIKKMEKEKKIIEYKAVLNHSKIGKKFCAYVLLELISGEYSDPERLAKQLGKFDEIESLDIITGDWEMILKIRTKDIEEYYQFLKTVLSRKEIRKIKSLNSLKQVKTEFVLV